LSDIFHSFALGNHSQRAGTPGLTSPPSSSINAGNNVAKPAEKKEPERCANDKIE
jgi:hypothetical protein